MVTDLLTDRTYVPTAIYYREADFLEYVREDTPHISRRVDEYLTLILSMTERQLIGLRIKGFRHLYMKFASNKDMSDASFFLLSHIFEDVMKEIGDNLFDEIERRKAYEEAISIAVRDQVQVRTDQIAA